MLLLISVGAFISTFLGGLLALLWRDKLHVISGFSAGAVLGVVFFDLLPESIELTSATYDSSFALSFVALGFCLYLVLDRLIVLHSHHEEVQHQHNHRGILGAGSFSVHSFLDGVAIGLAFQVSFPVGAVVALAVLAHDFSDGINTVNVVLKNGGTRKQALRWLFSDSLAPVLGIIAASLFTFSEGALGLLLSVFAGFFLYIGASDLLPESYHNHPTVWTTIASLFGIGLIYLVITAAPF